MSSLAPDIVRVARSKVGSKDWMYSVKKDEFAANTNKCNKFVYDVVVEAKVKPAPEVSVYLIFSRPPTAGEWADPKVTITGWDVVTTPQAGDVVAEAHRYADATGHVGIVVAAGLTVSAASTVGGVIVENDWGFREGQTPTFRRYTR
jgi:hypothetical protein